MVHGIRAKSAPKAKAKPLDPTRAVKADPRDPRTSRKNWPCYGQHQPRSAQSNQHGQWTWIHCSVCDLRIIYTPRVGSDAQHTVDRPSATRTTSSLELRALLGGAVPTSAIFRAMLSKLIVEEVLNNLVADPIATVTPTPTTRRSSRVRTEAPAATSEEPINESWLMTVGVDKDEDLAAVYEEEPQRPLRKGRSSEPHMVRPLVNSVAHKVMSVATLMATTAAGTLMNLHFGGCDGLWEIACAPHSCLSEAASKHNLQPRRINLNTSFDLYQAETWDRLCELRRRLRPQRLWFSLTCTKWCPRTSVNYSRSSWRPTVARKGS